MPKHLREVGIFWLSAVAILAAAQVLTNGIGVWNALTVSEFVQKSTIPLAACIVIFALLYAAGERIRQQVAPYVLFFAISATSVLGLTKTLTGSHATSTNLLLFGLSFYTASLAYIVHSGRLSLNSALLASNPILIITGPIATQFRDIRYRGMRRRIEYFLPYVVLGLFLQQTVATPLTKTFGLLNETDVLSSLAFATIFELFVYANFCGLSLIVFGLAGLAGFKVPLNFRQPFSSTNVIDFWRGWHTSLSTVLKVLFYAPSKKLFGTTAALFAVYLASAMWHGVTLNFLLWGLFHAAMFVLTMRLLRRGLRIPAFLALGVAVVIGRMLFADSDSSRLFEKLQFKFVDFTVLYDLYYMPGATKLALGLIIVFVALEILLQTKPYFSQRNYKFYRLPVIQFAMLALMLVTIADGVGVDYAVYGQR
jgi:D-alanyl-lipoteichoic acid acyltransferase DltB (MBOAT superfamily)